MEINYYIMRKNEPITLATFNEDGTMLSFSKKIRNLDIAPIQDRYQLSWLKEWWKERSVPIGQGKIQNFLRRNGYILPSEYLISNLGLSLTDYYWIKPVESELTWEDVNLFDNEFTENLLYSDNDLEMTADNGPEPLEDTDQGIPHYSPNGSLQGTIEKTWSIGDDGNRYLIKGNKSIFSSESINEVIACEIHKRQGYRNHAAYELMKIHHKEYDFGCCSKLFTSQKYELISGFAVYTYEKNPNNISAYDHFLDMCQKFGVNRDEIRRDLEYQILTDFIMSGYDRHLNNIGLIRDADTLKILGTAPIFDSGGSFFANKPLPVNDNELLDIETYGFCSRETSLLKLVKEPDIIDLTKLPPASYIREMYEKDSQIPEKRITGIVHWYEKKIELCRRFQLGESLNKSEGYSFPVIPHKHRR